MKKKQVDFQWTVKEKDFLKKSRINTLYLFGSQVTHTAGPMSDFDFGVLLEGYIPMPRVLRTKLYDKLLEMFELKIKRVCNIDIVFLREAPLQLQFQAISEGEILFESNPKARADYHAKIMEAYADFLPLQRIFEQATLARI